MPSKNQLNISNFIWSIADDVLRDHYSRGKYRDIILPMTVIRRLDTVLELTKQKVLDTDKKLKKANISNKSAALCNASGEAFYNISPFTLRDLKARARRQQLQADFENYLDGFSENVQEIIDKFKFRNQIPELVNAKILDHLIEKFLDSKINFSPKPVQDNEGNELLPALDNHSMGTIFEELIRRFNEENNEEAGEHFTPRDVVKLMADLIFLPVANKIKDATYLVYDGACGTGGMLTVAEERLTELAEKHEKDVSIHLYGQEINPETYAICKADLLLKGEGQEAQNIKYGSTLSDDVYTDNTFDFMLSNPPYGKKWTTDLSRMGGKKEFHDPRFIINYADEPEYKMFSRSSDAQLMFLVNKLSKMNNTTPLGSRIAEVHNGSSLFTGDAGGGESNIRRWIIENDWLEAIIALPLNIFYNTGIATYIWLLSNRKAKHRKGKVQLIDATQWYQPLRKNLGKKTCALSDKDIRRIYDTFNAFEESEHSKIFPNKAFGYWKVTVERPLRIEELSSDIVHKVGEVREARAKYGTVENAKSVIAKIHKKDVKANSLHGRFETTIKGKSAIVEYEPDPDLRDTEQIPLLEEGGIEAFLKREVLPYAPDAWYNPKKTKIGYEVSFTRHFYKPQPMRSLEEIRADILALERETEGLLEEITGGEQK